MMKRDSSRRKTRREEGSEGWVWKKELFASNKSPKNPKGSDVALFDWLVDGFVLFFLRFLGLANKSLLKK